MEDQWSVAGAQHDMPWVSVQVACLGSLVEFTNGRSRSSNTAPCTPPKMKKCTCHVTFSLGEYVDVRM